MATRNMDTSGNIDLAEVQKVIEFMKKSAVADINKEENKREEFDESWVVDQNHLHEVNRKPTYNNKRIISNSIHYIEEDAEIIEMVCCKSIRISSRDRTKILYQFLLGEYKMVEREFMKPIYVKEGNRKLYLSQPVSQSRILGYSWGVSHTPEAKWGYVRSSKASACPDMAGQWKVYDKNMKRWSRDLTLSVTCGPGI